MRGDCRRDSAWGDRVPGAAAWATLADGRFEALGPPRTVHFDGAAQIVAERRINADYGAGREGTSLPWCPTKKACGPSNGSRRPSYLDWEAAFSLPIAGRRPCSARLRQSGDSSTALALGRTRPLPEPTDGLHLIEVFALALRLSAQAFVSPRRSTTRRTSSHFRSLTGVWWWTRFGHTPMNSASTPCPTGPRDRLSRQARAIRTASTQPSACSSRCVAPTPATPHDARRRSTRLHGHAGIAGDGRYSRQPQNRAACR